MAVTTKKLFPATSNATTTVFSPVGIQLNNQDDLDVYVTLSGGTRVLQLRQSTGSTADSNHQQVNNTDGLYFPAVSAGTTLYNYQLSTDNNTITFNSALPQGAVVFCERRTRDADSSYTSFASGSTIRATDLNNSSTESNFTAQDGRNKAFTIEGVLFRGNQPSTNFVTSDHIVDGTIVEADLANSAVTSNKIADDAVTGAEIAFNSISSQHIINDQVGQNQLAPNSVQTTKIANGAVTTAKLADGAVGTDQLKNLNVTTAKIADDAVTTNKLADDAVTGAKIADNTINGGHYAPNSIGTTPLIDNAVTIDKIADAAIVTNSEQSSHSVNDTTFFTTAAAEARYFNASTGETIKDGQSFPDNDTTIATTAAINDRIIDLVDDVGGFVPIANETSFPTSNPDVNNGSGTIVSVSAASTNLVPSGTTVTIANGRGSGLAVIITGVSATIPSGFGFLVETTTTDHTYAFHRLSPKATEVTTVATNATQVQTVHTNISNINAVANNATNINAVAADATDIGAVAAKATEIGRLGTADAVADMAILGTADVVSDLNTLGTADVVADMNMLATSDVVADMNMLATSDVISDMNALATSDNITAMDTCRDNITSIVNASTNISSVNNFGDQYQVASNNPSTDGGGNALAAGDLYFNTSANELKVYTGSTWVSGVTATGNFAVVTGNTFTGDNKYNDGVKLNLGTGSDLQIYHSGTDSYIQDNGTGALFIGSGNTSGVGVYIRGKHGENSIIANSNGSVDLYYDNSKKFETTSTGATLTGVLISDGLTLLDNEKILFGNNNDLEIFHNGTNNIIQSDVGDLQINSGNSAGDVVINTNNNVNNNTRVTSAKFIKNGSVELYYNNSKKLETLTDGVLVTGKVAATGDLAITSSDGQKIRIGQSNDLQIYHNGSHSVIQNDTGTLFTLADNLSFKNNANSETLMTATANGSVELYHDNSKKLETKSDGIDVTGEVQCDSLDVDGAADFNGGDVDIRGANYNLVWDYSESALEFKDNAKAIFGSGDDLQIYHDGTKSIINEGGTGWLEINTNNLRVQNAAANETLLYATENGSVQLMYDNAKKLETTTNGARITGGLTTSGFGNTAANNTFGADMSHGARNVNIFASSTSANPYYSFVGTNLKLDGTNLVKNSDSSGSNWGNIAGIVFEGSNQGSNSGKNPAIRFLLDQPAGNGLNYSLGTHEGSGGTQVSAITSRTAAYFDTNGHFYHPDNKKAVYGTGEDLQIYHNGSHSFISDQGTGRLKLLTSFFNVQNDADNETIIQGISNGQVKLYYDNSKKFETTSAGVKAIDGVVVDAADYARLDFETDRSTASDNIGGLIFRAGGTNKSKLQSLVSGQINLLTGTNENMATFIPDGAVELYYDNSKKFETKSNGVEVTSSGDAHLTVTCSGHANLNLTTTSGSDHCSVNFGDSSDADAGEIRYTNSSNSLNFDTNGIHRFTIDSSGHALPASNNTYDLGSSSVRWRNVYTNDLNLSNEGSSNDVDGSWGDWTIQEGESDLFLKNNRSGKKYKFNLTEVS